MRYSLCAMRRPSPIIPAMPERPLYAPWRIDYIRNLDKPAPGAAAATGAAAGANDGCFLCAAAAATDPAEKRERLVLWTTDHCVVLINRFPYTNGHLLIAPRAHVADLENL